MSTFKEKPPKVFQKWSKSLCDLLSCLSSSESVLGLRAQGQRSACTRRFRLNFPVTRASSNHRGSCWFPRACALPTVSFLPLVCVVPQTGHSLSPKCLSPLFRGSRHHSLNTSIKALEHPLCACDRTPLLAHSLWKLSHCIQFTYAFLLFQGPQCPEVRDHFLHPTESLHLEQT